MKGITLVELTISMIIVGIMMGGIFAANYAILSMDKQTTARASLFVHGQAIVEAIKNDAIAATRDGSAAGITTSIPNSVCFHLGTAPADSWNCYSELSGVLYKCSPASPAACTTGTNLGTIYDGLSTADFSSGVFTMRITVNDPSITTSNSITLDVIAYPEGYRS